MTPDQIERAVVAMKFCVSPESDKKTIADDANICDSELAILARAAIAAAWEWRPIEEAPNNEEILIRYEDGSLKLIAAEENVYQWKAYDGKEWGVIKSRWFIRTSEFPEHLREHYSPPYRWSRRTAIYDRDKDSTVAWQCPDCGHVEDRHG